MDKEKNIECGKRLKTCRERKNLTKTALGEKLGYSAQHVYSLEKGSRTITQECADAAASVLDVRADYLLGKTDFPTMEAEILSNMAKNPPEEEDIRAINAAVEDQDAAGRWRLKLETVFNAYLNGVLGYKEIGVLESQTESLADDNGIPCKHRTDKKVFRRTGEGPALTSNALDYVVYDTPHGSVALCAADVQFLQIEIVKFIEMRLRLMETNIRTEAGWPVRPGCASYDSDYLVGLYERNVLMTDNEITQFRSWLKSNGLSEDKIVKKAGRPLEKMTLGNYKWFINHLDEIKPELGC